MRVRAILKSTGSGLLWMSLLGFSGGAAYLHAEDGPLRVSESDLKKAAIKRVNFEFPALARQLHLSGHAEVEVFVRADGEVEKVEPKSGNPLFTGAAATALKKWKFNPFKSAGEPVRAVGTLGVDFAIQ